MSGVAAIAGVPGSTIDAELLDAMTQVLVKRGPDQSHRWTQGSLALIHTLFRTVDESANEHQPLTFDGNIWITADARVDAREELVRRLRDQGREPSLMEPDVYLILHAYHVWGNDCLTHLLGDFAFIIIDIYKKSVFAARDHLGVKPLFFAQVPEGVVISNMLNCVRCHPHVSDTLNDSFICDFLLFGWNTDVTASAFADIHRLPAAHYLTWTSDQGLRTQRYWTLTVPDIIYRRKHQDYLDAFMDAFQKSIADRLRTDHVVISLSGGLDSASIAAAMLPLLARRSPASTVQAVTAVYDRIIPDRERYFTGLVAQYLNIPVEFVAGDDLECMGPNWEKLEAQYPEPTERYNPLSELLATRLSAFGRVVFSGEGGDEVVTPPRNYFRKLLSDRKFAQFAKQFALDLSYRTSQRGFELWQRLASCVRKRKSLSLGRPEFPTWISKELVTKYSLEQRMENFWTSIEIPNNAPAGFGVFNSFMFPFALDGYNSTAEFHQLEYRFPYIDLRMIQNCWTLPVIPFRYYKYMIRTAFKHRLPRAITHRRKQGLAGNILRLASSRMIDLRKDFESFPSEANRFTDGLKFINRPIGPEEDQYLELRLHELAIWTRNCLGLFDNIR